MTQTPGSGERTIVHLVPHTHWDREWYQPFQVFRMRLVELVDQLLATMDADPRLRFTLDGQVATVDDYLEVRPEARGQIEALVREGRLAIGPWQILMDEFLVSGETLIRNLELGWHAAQQLGNVMPIGYLPDMFGHVAQMPQILVRAGIHDAVVWRGVPAAIDRHAFLWSAPDGSTVRAEYLPGGYGNASGLLAVPDRLPQAIDRFIAESRAFFGDRSVLAMYGSDHTVPSPRLTGLVSAANEAMERAEVRIETLADYIQGARDLTGSLPAWSGELRSGARANMLMGVTSARIDIKQAAARAERALERYAEPLVALHGGQWPERLLEVAWRRVIDNSAHDSICGCSDDAVVRQVLVRFAEATQIADGVTSQAARAIAGQVPRDGLAAINPSPSVRLALVEFDVDATMASVDMEVELPDGSRRPTQTVRAPRGVMPPFPLAGRDIPAMLRRRMHGRELFGHSLDGFRVEQATGRPRLVLILDDPTAPDELDLGELVDAIVAASEAAPDDMWEIARVIADRRRVVARVPLPPLGWTAVRAVEATKDAAPGHAADTFDDDPPVLVTERTIENGLIDVVLADDGTCTLRGGGVTLAGVGRIVDGGDYGDSYNHAAPHADRLVDQPGWVTTRVLEAGPIRGRVEVVRHYGWPSGILPEGAARTDTDLATEVTTILELRQGEPFVRVTVAFGNRSRDHRVRWHIPLPATTDVSAAEGQFAVVERGMMPEAGHGEVPLPTYPARGFVHAAGATVLLDHVTEYELVDGRELALTLLRSVGLISRYDNPNREDPAGGEFPIPDAQMLRDWSIGFAIAPHAGSWSDLDAVGWAERYAHPALSVAGSADRSTPLTSAAGFQLDGDGVVLSSVRRRGDWLEVRLVAERPDAVRATLRGPFREAGEVDLLGRALGAVVEFTDGALHIELGPWEIKTLQIH